MIWGDNFMVTLKLSGTSINRFDYFARPNFQDSIGREDFGKRLNVLKRVLVKRNGRYLLFHHSFAEWLVDVKHCTQKYLCKTGWYK
jgi:hypothetical protein